MTNTNVHVDEHQHSSVSFLCRLAANSTRPSYCVCKQVLAGSTAFCTSLVAVLEGILRSINAPAAAQQSLRKDLQALQQSIVDIGHNRWVRLLSARTDIHAKLKLYEFKQLLDASHRLSSEVESLGCRPVPALNTTVQVSWLEMKLSCPV